FSAASRSLDGRALAVRLKAVLKPARFLHTQGVVKTARALAPHHGVDLRAATLAAWLHDCAKCLDKPTLVALLKPAGADAEERRQPALWHAPVGAYLACRDFGVKDKDVLAAIRLHTTGGPGQSPLQKLLFVADYIEPGRPDWPELPALRRLARRDLDAAWFEVLKHKLMHLIAKGRALHPRGLAAYHNALRSS
ncbi:MAG: bis(5'-nucleosyl)-tetraphosphatase (symmetrical) YqeK, partial [bacterium]